jgi:hypothetical protein
MSSSVPCFTLCGFDALKSAAYLMLNLLPAWPIMLGHSIGWLHAGKSFERLFVESRNFVMLVCELNVIPCGFHLSLPNAKSETRREGGMK